MIDMVNKFQTYVKIFLLMIRKITKFSLIFCVLLSTGCTVALSPLSLKEERLELAGNFEELKDYFEGDRGIFSERERSRILNENINRIRMNKSVTFEFTRYQLDWKRYILSVIEAGQLDQALNICNEGLRENEKLSELFYRYRYQGETDIHLNIQVRNDLNRLKGYIIWFKTGDENTLSTYFNAMISKRISPDKQSISFFDFPEKQKMRFLQEIGNFYANVIGDYRKALDYYLDGHSLIDKLTFLDIDFKYAYTQSSYMDIMDAYMKLGELEEAKEKLDQYNDSTGNIIYKTGKWITSSLEMFRGFLSTFDSKAGSLFALSRDFGTSKKYFDKALTVVDRIDPNSSNVWDRKAIGYYKIFYGAFYLGLQNKYHDAIDYVDKGIRYLKPSYSDAIDSWLNIENAYIYSGELNLILGNYDLALEKAQGALEFANKFHNRVGALSGQTLLGQILYKKGDIQKAKQAYEKALKLTNNIESTENWKLFYGLGQIYEEFGKEDEALAYYKQSVHEVEKLWQGRFKDTQRQVSFIDNRLVVFEPVIRILAKQNKAAEAFDYMERSKSRTFFETSLFYQEDKRKNPDINGKVLTAAEAMKILPNGSAILEYYVGENSVIGVVVTPRGLYIEELPIDTKQVKKDIMSFRNSIEELHTEYKEKGIDLYAKLIKPFEKTLADIESVCVIPHGVLHYLPFQALIVVDRSDNGIIHKLKEKEISLMAMLTRGNRKINKRVQGVRDLNPAGLKADNPDAIKSELESIRAQISAERERNGINDNRPYFLIDKFKISYAPSTTVLDVASRSNTLNKKRLLAVGSPPEAEVKDEGEDIFLGKLDSAKNEALQIGSFFEEKAVFTDEKATETVVKDNASKYDLLLFSTHGILNKKDPLKSFIFFNKDADNDGRLIISEIEHLNLKANLVALSACETGLVAGYEGIDENIVDAKFPYGDDLVGLQRAFIKSGSSSVLSSLWQVDDDSTAMLMIEFFKHYKGGENKASALQAAMRILMDDEHGRGWQHPYYWAPFIISGDWR